MRRGFDSHPRFLASCFPAFLKLMALGRVPWSGAVPGGGQDELHSRTRVAHIGKHSRGGDAEKMAGHAIHRIHLVRRVRPPSRQGYLGLLDQLG